MKIDENDFFHQATLRICGHLAIEAGMSSCLRYFVGIVPVDVMVIDLIDGNTGAIKTIARATAAGGERFERTTQIPPMPPSEVAKWAGRRSWIMNRPEEDPIGRRMTEAFGITDHSLLLLFLELDGQKIGKLVLAAAGRDRYTEEHERLVSLLNEPFAIALANALEHREVERLKELLHDDNRYLREEINRLRGEEIIGEDFGLAGVMDLVRQVSPRDSPVLLLGETGVGKDLIAKAVHDGSPRRQGPMIKINCGAIPETLLDSELFGHEKGAFTGALTKKRGRFERADGGTIFLDEVGELPPEAQVRLLRVLQTGEIERVGGSGPVMVDARVVAATNRDLEAMVGEGRFRKDLWFRLNVFPITVPPLRERRADIPALVQCFVDRKARRLKLETVPRLVPGALEPLMGYDWPGNVRELENVVERALILSRGGELSFDRWVPAAGDASVAPASEAEPEELPALDEVVARHIRRVLERTGGRVHGPGGAADMLGVNASTLRNRMKKLGIPYGRGYGR